MEESKQTRFSYLSHYKNTFYIFLFLMHIFLLYLTLIGALSPLFNDAQHRLGLGTDFAAYYNAGAAFLRGDGMYGQGPGFGFRYHPMFAATVAALLSKLTFNNAFLLWVVVQELALFFLVKLVLKVGENDRDKIIAITLLVFFSPYYLEVFMGNATFIVTVMLAWSFYFYQSNYVKHAVILLISIIIKPIGLVVLPAYFFLKDIKSILVIIIIVVLSALPFFLINPESFATFITINTQAIPLKGWVVHAGNQGLHGFFATIFTRFQAIPIHELYSYKQLALNSQYFLAALPVLFGCLAAFFSIKYAHQREFVFLLWIYIYLLAYKDIWEHSYTLMPLIFYLVYKAYSKHRKILLTTAIIMALPTAFILYDVKLPAGPIDPERYWDIKISMLHHATKSFPLLLLYSYLIYRAFKSVTLK